MTNDSRPKYTALLWIGVIFLALGGMGLLSQFVIGGCTYGGDMYFAIESSDPAGTTAALTCTDLEVNGTVVAGFNTSNANVTVTGELSRPHSIFQKAESITISGTLPNTNQTINVTGRVAYNVIGYILSGWYLLVLLALILLSIRAILRRKQRPANAAPNTNVTPNQPS